MLVYHGSNHNFRKLRIRKDLTSESSMLNEGHGIYFSTDESIAASYGKYLYAIYICEHILDFRIRETCKTYLLHIQALIYPNTGIMLHDFCDLEMITDCINSGKIAISDIGKQLQLQLYQNNAFNKLETKCISRVDSLLAMCDRNCPPVYLFPYHIKDCGIIKQVNPQTMFLAKIPKKTDTDS